MISIPVINRTFFVIASVAWQSRRRGTLTRLPRLRLALTRVGLILGIGRTYFLRAQICLSLILFQISCISGHDMGLRTSTWNHLTIKPGSLVVLVDNYFSLYQKVITGIHVASEGQYTVIKMEESSLGQSALFKKLISLAPSGLIVLGPESANAVQESQVLIPSVFAMVPNVATNYELDYGFVAGVSMGASDADKITLIKEVLPNTKSVGVIMGKHSRHQIEKLRTLFDNETLFLQDMEVASSIDIMPILRARLKDYDAILMTEDPMMLDMEILNETISFLNLNKKAFIALDCSLVERGALLALGVDFYALGGELFGLLKKAKSEKMYQRTSILDPESISLCVNMSAAETMIFGENGFSRLLKYAALKRYDLKTF